jgi:hypothetical protein
LLYSHVPERYRSLSGAGSPIWIQHGRFDQRVGLAQTLNVEPQYLGAPRVVSTAPANLGKRVIVTNDDVIPEWRTLLTRR